MAKQPQFKSKAQTTDTSVGASSFETGAGDVFGQLAVSFEQISNEVGKKAQILKIDDATTAGALAGQEGTPKLKPGFSRSQQAYNRAALQTYGAKLKLGASKQLMAAYAETKSNPGALEATYNDIRKATLKETLPELQAEVNAYFDRELMVGLENSGRIQEKRIFSANTAAAADLVEQSLHEIQRSAYSLDSSTRGAVIVGQQMELLEETLISQGPPGEYEYRGKVIEADPDRSGVFDVDDIQRIMGQASDNAITAKAMGEFDRATGLGDKQIVRNDLRPAWAKGDLDISEKQLTGIENRMDADLRTMRVEERAEFSALNQELKQVKKIIDQGFTVSSDIMDGLQVKISTTGNKEIAAAFEGMKDLADFQFQVRQLSPLDLQTVNNSMRDTINKAGGVITPQDLSKLQLVEKLLPEMTREVSRDPISWAVRVGLIDDEPLIFQGDAAAMSMQRRVATSNAIATHYGIAPKYLTDEEVASAKDLFPKLNVEEQLGFIQTMVLGFGEEAGRAVLARVSNDVPMLGHAGGLMTTRIPGAADSAKDILVGMVARAGGSKLLGPQDILNTSIAAVEGGALNFSATTRNTSIEAAKNIYTAQALRNGFVEGDDLDEDLWIDSLHKSVGGVMVDGVRFGGFGDYNDDRIVLPTGWTQDNFSESVGGISQARLNQGIPFGNVPRHENGESLTVEELQNSRLISVGDGQYLVDLSDNGTGFLHGIDPSQPFILNINEFLGDPDLPASQKPAKKADVGPKGIR